MFEVEKYSKLVGAAEEMVARAHDEYTGKIPFDKDWQGGRRAIAHIMNIEAENNDILTAYESWMLPRLKSVVKSIVEDKVENYFKTIGDPGDEMAENLYWRDRSFWSPVAELKAYVDNCLISKLEEETDKNKVFVIVDIGGTTTDFYEDGDYKETKLALKAVKIIKGGKAARKFIDEEGEYSLVAIEVGGEAYEETNPDYVD